MLSHCCAAAAAAALLPQLLLLQLLPLLLLLLPLPTQLLLLPPQLLLLPLLLQLLSPQLLLLLLQSISTVAYADDEGLRLAHSHCANGTSPLLSTISKNIARSSGSNDRFLLSSMVFMNSLSAFACCRDPSIITAVLQ